MDQDVALPHAIQVIKRAMADKGMRQVDLVGIFSQSGHVSELLRGKRRLSEAKAKLLAVKLEVPLEELLS